MVPAMEKQNKSANTDLMRMMLRQLRDAFLEELPERLDKLDNSLLAMEKKGVATAEEFNELYRSVHSIKGSGGTHGLHIISSICHQFEDRLNSINSNSANLTKEFISSSLAYTGLLRMAADEARQGREAFPEIEQKLLELHHTVSATKYSLLMVESSRSSVHIYAQALSKLPLHLVVADNGYTALLRVLSEPFNILVTSQEIPVLNGTALIGALRLSNSLNRGIQSVLLTSNAAGNKKLNRLIDANYVIKKDIASADRLHDTLRIVIATLDKASSAKAG